MRFFLDISYQGSAYHGWQRQKNAITVQEELEKSLNKLMQLEISTLGCGRTDAGVHAKKFLLHFDASEDQTTNLIYRLNGILPKDISANAIHEVSDNAHARFDAISRSYEYHLHQKKNPFLTGLSSDFRQVLNVHFMNEAAKHLLEESEFGAFCKAGSDNMTNICDVTEAFWEIQSERLIFHITADRFLRNMVRAIVGTLIEVGLGKITPVEFLEIIKSQNRSEAGVSVPAHGLYLTDIKYPYI